MVPALVAASVAAPLTALGAAPILIYVSGTGAALGATRRTSRMEYSTGADISAAIAIALAYLIVYPPWKN